MDIRESVLCRFCLSGGRNVLELALIEGYTCQLMGSPNSWNKTVYGWNLEAFNSNTNEKHSNWQSPQSLAFMKYKIIRFDLHVVNVVVNIPSSIVTCDEWS